MVISTGLASGAKSSLLVKEIADKATGNQADNRREGDGLGRRGESDAGNEDDGLNSLAENSDEGQDEHGVALRPLLEPAVRAHLDRLCKGLGKLHSPLDLHLSDTKERGAHYGDDERSKQTERAFIIVLVLVP